MSFKEYLQEVEEENKGPGIVVNIEKDTVGNDNFRKVIFTGEKLQLVLMALKADEEIGEETHKTVDQFFRVDEGSGKVIMNDKETEISNGSAFVIPMGTKHNVIAGSEGMKVYSIYTPPNHPDGTIHKTKEDAIADKEDEAFGKKVGGEE